MRSLVLLLATLLLARPAAAGIVQHDLDVRLDPASRQLQATDHIRIDGSTALEFLLAPGLHVASVRVDGAPARIAGHNGQWRVALDETAHDVTVEYGGQLTPFARHHDPQGGSDAMAGPEGAFLPAGTGWFPITREPRAPSRISVTVPKPFTAVATGRLVEESAGPDGYRAIFQDDRPVEPPSLFAGPFVVKETRHGGLRLRTYLTGDQAGLADDLLASTASHLDRFQREIGPYPFDGFAIVSGALPVGLGFPGLTYVSRQVLPLPFFRGQSLAHEILHNWWGNGVLVAYSTGNWAEGLTTYMADHALAEARGPAAADMRLGWLRDYAALPAARDTALAAFTGKRHEADQVVGYNKAAFLFHMLRRRLGDEGFRAGIQRFWNTHRFQVAGWGELRRAFEATSGTDLSEFFGQWLDRPGAPSLELADAGVQDGNRVVLTLRQAGPAYDLAVPVALTTAAGTEYHTMALRDAETVATVAASARPVRVTLDPDFDLFRRLAPGEAPPILRDVMLDDTAMAVIATADDGAAVTARALATRLLERTPDFVDASVMRQGKTALLLIGTEPEVAALLPGAVPAEAASAGTGRAWTARDRQGRSLLVVMARDAAALEALARPLPHYGRQSYLVFDGRQVVARGIWPSDHGHLSRALR